MSADLVSFQDRALPATLNELPQREGWEAIRSGPRRAESGPDTVPAIGGSLPWRLAVEQIQIEARGLTFDALAAGSTRRSARGTEEEDRAAQRS